MKYLLDSDWIADWLKGKSEAQQLVSSFTSDDEIFISIISYGEIYEGIYYGNDPKKYAHTFYNLLRGIKILPLTLFTLRRFAKLRGDLRFQGRLIADMDLLIASTALANELTLVTRNLKHFERIPNLKILR